MKRYISMMFPAVLILILLSNSVCPQGITGRGVKAGLNIARVYGDDVPEDVSFKWAFCAGGFITSRVTETFAIQPEFLYTRKGARYEEEGPEGETVIWTMTLDYLEVPVLVKLSLPTSGNIRPNMLVGPAVAFKVGARGKVEFAGESIEEDLEDIKGVDYGLVFGAGSDLSLAAGKITFDARYTLGLATIDDSEASQDVKNGVISVMVGYSF